MTKPVRLYKGCTIYHMTGDALGGVFMIRVVSTLLLLVYEYLSWTTRRVRGIPSLHGPRPIVIFRWAGCWEVSNERRVGFHYGLGTGAHCSTPWLGPHRCQPCCECQDSLLKSRCRSSGQVCFSVCWRGRSCAYAECVLRRYDP